MTIDEHIRAMQGQAEWSRKYAKENCISDDRLCLEQWESALICAENCEQVAEWLEELKELRKMREDIESNANALENNGYIKAIDSLKNKVIEDIEARTKSWKGPWQGKDFELMEYAATTCEESLRYFAKQLKEGVNSES